MWCLRVILGVSRWDQKRNTELRVMAGIKRVEVFVMRRRLRWLGHLEWMNYSRLPKCLLMCHPQVGKRLVGVSVCRVCLCVSVCVCVCLCVCQPKIIILYFKSY